LSTIFSALFAWRVLRAFSYRFFFGLFILFILFLLASYAFSFYLFIHVFFFFLFVAMSSRFGPKEQQASE